MTHETFDREEAVKVSSDRSFGFVFTVVFALIGFWPLIHAHPPRWWSVGIAAAFLVVSLVRPVLLAPLNKLWLRFGLLLHKIVNPLVMGMLFYLVLTPFGFVLRRLGKDPLRRGFDAAAQSYWIVRTPPGPLPESMKNQF
jgi:hypothetical protein